MDGAEECGLCPTEGWAVDVAEVHVDQPGRKVRCWRTPQHRLELFDAVQLRRPILLTFEPTSKRRALEHNLQRLGRPTLARGMLQFAEHRE
jgi:hypothetical protein